MDTKPYEAWCEDCLGSLHTVTAGRVVTEWAEPTARRLAAEHSAATGHAVTVSCLPGPVTFPDITTADGYVLVMCDPCAAVGVLCDGCNVTVPNDRATVDGTATGTRWAEIPKRMHAGCRPRAGMYAAGPVVSPTVALAPYDSGIGGCVVCGARS